MGFVGGLDVEGLHRIIKRFFHLIRIGSIHEFEMDAVLFVHETEETDGATVEVIGRDDGIPRLEEFHNHGNGGHAGGIAGTVTAVFQGGYHLFRAFPGGVLDPGIVVARRFTEFRVAECGTLENGDRNAAGGIFPVASVNADCFDIHMNDLPFW